MKQIEHRIFTTFIIACRSIDGHTTLHLQRRTRIPDLAQIAMGHLIHTIQVALVPFRITNDEDIGERHDVTIHIDIGGILHALHAINIKGITIHLRSQLVCGIAPYTILTFLQLSNAGGIILTIARDINLLCRQEVARHLHFNSFGSE